MQSSNCRPAEGLDYWKDNSKFGWGVWAWSTSVQKQASRSSRQAAVHLGVMFALPSGSAGQNVLEQSHPSPKSTKQRLAAALRARSPSLAFLFICGAQHVCVPLSIYQARIPHLKCIHYLIKFFLFGIIASNFNFLTRVTACQPVRQWRADRRWKEWINCSKLPQTDLYQPFDWNWLELRSEKWDFFAVAAFWSAPPSSSCCNTGLCFAFQVPNPVREEEKGVEGCERGEKCHCSSDFSQAGIW